MRRHLVIVCLATVATVAAGAQTSAPTLDEARQLHIAGEYRAALAAYARVAEALAVSDPASAATARNNACVIHNGFGEFERARDECAAALALRRGLDDDRRLARTLNNLAIAQQNLGEYDAAGASFREALDLNTRRGDALARVLNLSNLGALATLRGAYGEALDYHRRAVELASEHPDEPWAAEQLQVATINRGVVLEQLGAYREALELYRDLVESPPGEMTPRRLAQLRLNSGVIYRNLGDPVRAVREFEQVAALYRDLEDPDGLSNALLNLALALHLNLERWDEAEAAYRQALALAVRHGDRPEEIRDLFYLGGFLLERGRLDEAEEMYRRCLAAAEQSGSARGRWSALAGLGRIAAARGDLPLAAERLSGAIDEIERIGAEVGEAGLRSGFFGDRRPVYADAAQVWADLHRLEPGAGHAAAAFEVAQRAKARSLLDALGDRAWAARPLTAGAVERLELRQPVLEYFAAGRDLLRWRLGAGGGLEMANLGPHEPIARAALGIYRRLEEGGAPDPERLGELSAALLAGAGLESRSAGALHLAPGGSLDRLPFEILPLPGDPSTALAERHAVSYVPSVSTLVWLRERRQRGAAPPPRSPAVLGFADPRLPSADAESALGLVVARYSLAPLPAAAAGLEALARRIPGRRRLFTGATASEAAFRAAAPAGARVVHLATHAVVDERPGRGAAVLLVPGDGHDGLLEPREIAALEQPAELTVLASCRSALESGSGGALSALTGAFLAAGSAAVVATLWDVGDAATAAFMEQFYYQLGRGREPAVALAEAKRALRARAEWSAPHLWSGYVLVGEAPPVAAAGRWRSAAAAVLAVLALLVAAGAWLLWRRRR